jgi:hypothetical protein
MRRDSTRESTTDRAVPLFLLAALLLLAPATRVWANGTYPWWLIFAVWALIIVLARLSR